MRSAEQKADFGLSAMGNVPTHFQHRGGQPDGNSGGGGRAARSTSLRDRSVRVSPLRQPDLGRNIVVPVSRRDGTLPR